MLAAPMWDSDFLTTVLNFGLFLICFSLVDAIFPFFTWISFVIQLPTESLISSYTSSCPSWGLSQVSLSYFCDALCPDSVPVAVSTQLLFVQLAPLLPSLHGT